MTKKNWLLILFAVALAATYVIYFTDWFRPKTVLIFHSSRNTRPRLKTAKSQPSLPSLNFGLNRKLILTEITVVPLTVWQTNSHVLPLWHLIATSNAVPVKMFAYGDRIPGLKPAVPGTRALPLDTNVVYRLLVTAGKVEGQHDFELK